MWMHPKIRTLTTPRGQEFIAFLIAESTQPSSECWIWPGSLNRDGYGVILLDFQPFLVHRMSFELHKGFIPQQFVVMHQCDVRRCWKPEHLFLGTPSENSQDMWRKGRSGIQRKLREDPRGNRCHNVNHVQIPYGFAGDLARLRCLLPLGHDGEHRYDLL